MELGAKETDRLLAVALHLITLPLTISYVFKTRRIERAPKSQLLEVGLAARLEECQAGIMLYRKILVGERFIAFAVRCRRVIEELVSREIRKLTYHQSIRACPTLHFLRRKNKENLVMQADLLSSPINYAVVQLPERNYPGVVVQGDTLHIMKKQVAQMGRLLSAMDLEELAIEIQDLNEQLSSALNHFERVCSDRGIALPY